jgi:hypothetical protein
MVVKLYLEPEVEGHFHPDSYGYRPGKSALDAVGHMRFTRLNISVVAASRRRREYYMRHATLPQEHTSLRLRRL